MDTIYGDTTHENSMKHFVNTFDNLDETDKFLERHKLPKLT